LEPHGLGFRSFSHMFAARSFQENWQQFCKNWSSGFWFITAFVFLPLDGIRTDV